MFDKQCSQEWGGPTSYKFILKKSPKQALTCKFGKYFSHITSGRLLLINILLLTKQISAPKCYCWPGFLFPLNIFRDNNVDLLYVAISGVPRHIVVTGVSILLIIPAIRQKRLYQNPLTPAQMFSWEFFEIFRKAFFTITEHLRTAVSDFDSIFLLF